MDLPPVIQERIICAVTAAHEYRIPANILLAVAEKEGGTAGRKVRNTNGTYDVGTMQFNTSYLKELRKYGVKEEYANLKGCYPFRLAAWRLRDHLANDKGDIWTRAANYHSRTYKYNQRYRKDLIRKSAKWGNWLNANYATFRQSLGYK